VILVLDQAQADLAGPELTCPHCPGRLRRWGFARTRSLRSSGGGRVWLRPRRVRCASCRVTHVLLPALAPPHRAYTIDLVGQALLASACGHSHRAIGADLGVPPDTVRDWIRRVRARAEWLRVQGTIAAHTLDPMLPVIVPAGSALADAMSALATAAAASVRRLGPTAPPWQIIAMIACGQLLAPMRSG
jgi:Domain of unknown function (DUF6431)/Homeodomain-like domain